jgi:hypothetical protein
MGQVDVIGLSWVRRFRGLTWVIWAENGGTSRKEFEEAMG